MLTILAHLACHHHHCHHHYPRFLHTHHIIIIWQYLLATASRH